MPAHIHQPSRCPIRLGRIAEHRACAAHHRLRRLGKFLDGEVRTHADVRHRWRQYAGLRFINGQQSGVFLVRQACRAHAGFGHVVSPWRAGAPYRHAPGVILSGFVRRANHEDGEEGFGGLPVGEVELGVRAQNEVLVTLALEGLHQRRAD